MITLKNEKLTVQIAQAGAELKSVKDNTTNVEYMWQANPEYWGRTSPILFPIVGKLKNDTYYVKNNAYHLGQHGFARDMEFSILTQTETEVTFQLVDNETSLQKYPFHFELIVAYTLKDDTIDVLWEVKNPDKTKELPFAIGAHPAFNLQMFDADMVEDFYLEFDKEMKMSSWKLSDGNFIDDYLELGTSDSLKLDAELFVGDALVFRNIDLKTIALKNIRNNHGVTMDLTAFTFANKERALGIWSPYSDGGIAPFICIEPWFGHADTVEGPFEIEDKPGILKLHSKDTFNSKYSLKFY